MSLVLILQSCLQTVEAEPDFYEEDGAIFYSVTINDVLVEARLYEDCLKVQFYDRDSNYVVVKPKTFREFMETLNSKCG